MKDFPNIDPYSYERKGKRVINPITYYKLNKAARQAGAPYEMVKQQYHEQKYGIPSNASLEYMKGLRDMFRSSSESLKPQRKGYEFQILKN